MANERNAGRKPMYNVPSKVLRVLIRTDKQKEMKDDIKVIQDRYSKM